MKKLFTLFLFSLLSTLCAVAQDSSTFQFVDKGGNTVANGTSLTVSELTEDEIMGNFISTGLSVKNTSDSKASVRISYQIETLDNGMFQICFPSSCITKTTRVPLKPLKVRWLLVRCATCSANGLQKLTARARSRWPLRC